MRFNGEFEISWLKSDIDEFVAAVNKDVNTPCLSQPAVMGKNKGFLQRNTYTYLQPEQMHSFEAGDRNILRNIRLFMDDDDDLY